VERAALSSAKRVWLEGRQGVKGFGSFSAGRGRGIVYYCGTVCFFNKEGRRKRGGFIPIRERGGGGSCQIFEMTETGRPDSSRKKNSSKEGKRRTIQQEHMSVRGEGRGRGGAPPARSQLACSVFCGIRKRNERVLRRRRGTKRGNLLIVRERKRKREKEPSSFKNEGPLFFADEVRGGRTA